MNQCKKPYTIILMVGILPCSVFTVEKNDPLSKECYQYSKGNDIGINDIELYQVNSIKCNKIAPSSQIKKNKTFKGSNFGRNCFKKNTLTRPGCTKITIAYKSVGKCGSHGSVIAEIDMSKNQSVKMPKKNLLSKEDIENFAYPNSALHQDKSGEHKKFAPSAKDTLLQILTQNQSNEKEFTFFKM